MRDTRQRQAIRDAFAAAGRPLHPKEILQLASKSIPSLGIATVYRNLRLMVEQGEVEEVPLPGQPPRYCPPRTTNNIVFLCEKSDRAFCIPTDGFELPQLPDGFVPRRWELVVYGDAHAPKVINPAARISKVRRNGKIVKGK